MEVNDDNPFELADTVRERSPVQFQSKLQQSKLKPMLKLSANPLRQSMPVSML